MTREEALSLLELEVKMHKLERFSCRINNRLKSTLGQVRWRKNGDNLIELSGSYIDAACDSAIIDTVLHEIAHACVGFGHSHDGVWKSAAAKLGAKVTQGKTRVQILNETEWY